MRSERPDNSGRRFSAKEDSRIVSIVSSCKIRSKFDLGQICQEFDSDYDPDVNVPYMIYRPEYTSAKAIVYSKGSIVLAGEKTFSSMETTQEKLIKEFSDRGYDTSFARPWKISNIVSKVTLRHMVRLSEIPPQDDIRMEYEPEQFPGAILHFNSSKVVILVFSSGNVMVTGAKSDMDLQMAYEYLGELINII
jgi:transcription initiation factor TFIID TATA-box-binding protein